MKVCMVGFFVYSGDGRVKGYAESLYRAGVGVDVLSISGSGRKKTDENRGVRVFNIPIHRTRKNLGTYLLEYGSAFLFLGFLLTRMFFIEHYDVIHVHNMPDFLVFTGLIPKLFGAKIILDIHDPMPEVYMSKYPVAKNGWGVRLIRLEEKTSTGFADAVITANSHFRENLVKRGVRSSKVTVVHNFPDPNIFNRSAYSSRKKKLHERFTLIFPGTIAPRYGLEVAIKAMPLIKSTVKNIRLLIIGQQVGYLNSLISLADRLGVASIVEFWPPMRIEDIPDMLMQADIGIYPALPDPHMTIAVPGKLLEFAAMGLPILSSRLEIVEELFDPSALMFFEPGNVDQFAQCVIKLYKNPKLREELVHNADRTFVQTHSWEQEFYAYLGVLARLSPREIKTIDMKYLDKIPGEGAV
jgi:glycosyltransferase involved in cell wall biosynthesis